MDKSCEITLRFNNGFWFSSGLKGKEWGDLECSVNRIVYEYTRLIEWILEGKAEKDIKCQISLMYNNGFERTWKVCADTLEELSDLILHSIDDVNRDFNDYIEREEMLNREIDVKLKVKELDVILDAISQDEDGALYCKLYRQKWGE